MGNMKFNNLVDVILALDLCLSSREVPSDISEYEEKIFVVALTAMHHFDGYPEQSPGSIRQQVIQEAAERIYNYRNG